MYGGRAGSGSAWKYPACSQRAYSRCSTACGSYALESSVGIRYFAVLSLMMLTRQPKRAGSITTVVASPRRDATSEFAPVYG